MGESQGEPKLHLGERKGDQSGSTGRKEYSIVKKGEFYKGEGGQAKRTFLGEVGESMSG